MNYRIRFHLGKGTNYKHWQIIKHPTIFYLNPFEYNLILKNCYLKNNKKVAERIFNGKNKTVCAWLYAENIDFVINSNFDRKKYKIISYNPKKSPNWVDINGIDIDNSKFQEIRSIGKDLYAII